MTEENVWSAIRHNGDVRKSQQLRRKFLENELRVNTSYFEVDPSRTGRIENTIGCMQLPLGVVGPVLLQGQFAGEYMVPLVTTETCLVAGCQRGSKFFNESGGIAVEVKNLGITRSIGLKCASAAGCNSVKKFIEENLEKVKLIVESTSKHLQFIKLDFAEDESFLHVKLTVNTEEAMGMNMVTIALTNLTKDFILKEAPVAVRLIAESSNFCSDKKASALVMKEGRGRFVRALGLVPSWLMKSWGLKYADFAELAEIKLKSGSNLAGALGQNAHHANMVAAFYAAFGQDLAHTVEGSLGKTNFAEDEKGMFVSVELPAVLVGTMGGGTKLPQVQELFKMVGVVSGQSGAADKLAALLGAIVLCGEFSLMLALLKQELAEAHERMR